MKTKIIFFIIYSWTLILSAVPSIAQKTIMKPNSPATGAIEVIQFHSQHRCMTCNKIEEFTKATLKSYPDIPFLLVNVDEKRNEKKAEQFEATGTSLFVYNPKTGKKKDLTDFAFMNAGNKDKFIKGLKKEIDIFLKP